MMISKLVTRRIESMNGYFKYLYAIVHKQLDKMRRGKFHLREMFVKNPHLVAWTGANNVHLNTDNEKYLLNIRNYYAQVKGNFDTVTIHSDRQISYDDHLPRIRTQNTKIETGIFHRPSLTDVDYTIVNIRDSLIEKEKIENIANQFPHLRAAPQPFDYSMMEKNESLNAPVCVGLPGGYPVDYIFNENDEVIENVLHMPIKITKGKEHELKEQKRVVANSNNEIKSEYFYLPKELAYVRPLIEYACGIELMYNPFFMDDYYIFISVSHSIIPTNSMQRRGGWHIDGHQGAERYQKTGEKLPTDRQYIICNELPTLSVQHQFNLDEVRAYCKKRICHIDSVNMQDVIEHEISKVIANRTVKSIEPNKLNFLNPYMVHKAAVNTGAPVKRTFLRILFSTFKRDRLGDTVNPIIGPLWQYKIKNITDIHEMKR